MTWNKQHPIRVALGALVVSIFMTGDARALSVAGWDFSQYAGVGTMTINSNFDPADTLPANYSNLDPSFGAGAQSALFGTMYIDGQFGSTDVAIDFSANEPIVPTSGSLSSNLNQPQLFNPTHVPFDSFNVLQAEGQEFANLLSMTAQDAVNVVFSANWDAVPEFGTSWSVSFGARVFDLLPGAAESATFQVRYSQDGSSYSAPTPVAVSEIDTRFEIPLLVGPSERLYVLMSFVDPSGTAQGGQVILDNVSVNALSEIPEPGTGMLLLTGLGLVGTAAIRRRA
jgi:hypothetical protein